jgi:hypothetical protein
MEGELIVKFIKQILALFLSYSLVLAAAPQTFAAQPGQSATQPPVQAAQPTPEQLQQLGETGAQEIVDRRIAENEATAIEVCEEFALSETEGNSKLIGEEKAASEDPITRFAQSLATAGTTNADASARAAADQGSYLFHGYYFRRLTGDSVAVGAKKKGLLLVAYPADYRSSGIKTFLVTRKGIVFKKDLGPDTTMAAPSITFRTSGWRPAE